MNAGESADCISVGELRSLVLYGSPLPESLQSSLLNEFVFQKGYLINHKKDTQMNKNIKQCIEYNLSTIQFVIQTLP